MRQDFLLLKIVASKKFAIQVVYMLICSEKKEEYDETRMFFFEEAMHADVLLQVCDSSPDISLALYVALSLAVGCR